MRVAFTERDGAPSGGSHRSPIQVSAVESEDLLGVDLLEFEDLAQATAAIGDPSPGTK